jgi:hypothetical protein
MPPTNMSNHALPTNMSNHALPTYMSNHALPTTKRKNTKLIILTKNSMSNRIRENKIPAT